MKSYRKALTLAVYALGAATAAALSAILLARVEYVPFPDTMLPAQLWELAIDWLALGTLPMALAAWGMVRAIDARGKKVQFLLFLPVLPCLGCLLLLGAVFLMAMFSWLSRVP